MAAYFESADLPGFANWMRVQNQEEKFHATKFYDYILERGGRVTLRPIEAPPSDWDSPLAVFEATLKHEQKVTGLINDLMYLAREVKDNASEIFLQWFVNEQVEEEDNVSTVLGQLKLIKDSPQALYLMDKEMAQRIFTPPTTEGE
jgi:ferritin